MNLLRWGKFIGHSGRELQYKIECDTLNRDDWHCAAMLIYKLSPSFRRVIGIPRGGLPLQKNLDLLTEHHSPNVLIVDDVWTTGASMFNKKLSLISEGVKPEYIYGAVIFARSSTPEWVKPVFQLHEDLYRL